MRTVIDPSTVGISSIESLGRYNYTRANPPLIEHSHTRCMEICYLVKGDQKYYLGEKKYSLRGGDFFFTLPNEKHGTGEEPEGKGMLYWISILDPQYTKSSLLGLPPQESQIIWTELTRKESLKHFPGTPQIKSILDSLTLKLLSHSKTIHRIEINTQFLSFLLLFLEIKASHKETDEDHRFGQVLQHIEKHLDQPQYLSVKLLAEKAKLSESRFKESFKKIMGMPPAEYCLRMRVKEAENRLLKQTCSVTEIAFDLGFSSSQYFASTFKRFTNRTPKAFILNRRTPQPSKKK